MSRVATHGTDYMYSAKGCRCDECRAFQSSNRSRIRTEPMPVKVQHGTPSAYTNYACRCDACKAAGRIGNHAAYQRLKAKKAA